jgi:hypothetical protein
MHAGITAAIRAIERKNVRRPVDAPGLISSDLLLELIIDSFSF